MIWFSEFKLVPSIILIKLYSIWYNGKIVNDPREWFGNNQENSYFSSKLASFSSFVAHGDQLFSNSIKTSSIVITHWSNLLDNTVRCLLVLCVNWLKQYKTPSNPPSHEMLKKNSIFQLNTDKKDKRLKEWHWMPIFVRTLLFTLSIHFKSIIKDNFLMLKCCIRLSNVFW